jgi:hypothetical protein
LGDLVQGKKALAQLQLHPIETTTKPGSRVRTNMADPSTLQVLDQIRAAKQEITDAISDFRVERQKTVDIGKSQIPTEVGDALNQIKKVRRDLNAFNARLYNLSKMVVGPIPNLEMPPLCHAQS